MTRLPLILFLAVACASPKQISRSPVIGTPAELERFAGTWRGTVDAPPEQVRSPLEFVIRSTGSPSSASFSLSGGQAVHILWIRLSGRTMTGAVEPYFDASCSCEVYAIIEATLDETGRRLRGSFRQRVQHMWRDTATWSAERVDIKQGEGDPSPAEQHAMGDERFKETVSALLHLLSRAPELFERSDTDRKRMLLSPVCSNFKL